MLDLIFPVHAANLELMVNDPCWESEDDMPSFEGAMPRAIRSLDVPHRIIVSAEGGLRNELTTIQSYLEDRGAPWIIVHEDLILGYEKAVRAALEHVRSPLVAIIPPWAWIKDSKWFGKMQQVFRVDGRTHTVSALPTLTGSATLPPNRFARRYHPTERVVTVAKRDAMKTFGEAKSWAEAIDNHGGTRWEHPGVRIEPQPYEPHDARDSRKRQVAANDSPSE